MMTWARGLAGAWAELWATYQLRRRQDAAMRAVFRGKVRIRQGQ